MVARVAASAAVVLCLAAAPRLPQGPGPLGAREVAALTDMAALRDAEIAAYLDTGYFFPLEDLNDLLESQTLYYFDDIMYGGGARALSLQTGNFVAQRVDVRFPPRRWGGPYVNFQQGGFSVDGAGYDPGTPTDPWGNPYYLFSPLGLVHPWSGTVTLDLYGDAFDRWTLVSLAGDGVMSADDLIVPFEASFGPPTTLVISSLSPSRAAPGTHVTVRGYNFGAVQGTSRIELDGRAVGTIVSWGDRTIVFVVPSGAASGPVVVVRELSRSNTVLLRIPAAVARWVHYR
ncbi:MAG: IPT/TIG domain-containing protein [Candidatus Sumerlaeia bacterium]|nr:IPT/TIG domain-containing protein [Candidatus Sumerlaeia bacterium]